MCSVLLDFESFQPDLSNEGGSHDKDCGHTVNIEMQVDRHVLSIG